jgi:hypothetical protein
LLASPGSGSKHPSSTEGAAASAAALEKQFGEIVQRETRATRVITVLMSCIGYTVATVRGG